MHVFVHRGAPYAFVERDASDWMSRHFFSGGMMPSDDLALRFQDDLRLLAAGAGTGATTSAPQRRGSPTWTANARLWCRSSRRCTAPTPSVWWMRWRLFFLSVAELFGHAEGQQWGVGHYLFERRP